MKLFTIFSSLPVLIALVSVVAANSMATPDLEAGIPAREPVAVTRPAQPSAPAPASLIAWELKTPEQPRDMRLTD